MSYDEEQQAEQEWYEEHYRYEEYYRELEEKEYLMEWYAKDEYIRDYKKIKLLGLSDYKSVKKMDDDSGYNVLEHLEYLDPDGQDVSKDAYGVFVEKKLIGYCTINKATRFNTGLFSPKENALTLCDVYIDSEYRGHKCASDLINHVVNKYRDNSMYLTIKDKKLVPFYERFQFYTVDGSDYAMHRSERERER